MITIVTEAAVDPKFLTSTDVSDMRAEIPRKEARVDALQLELADKMGIDERVPWENIDDPIQADAAAGISGIANVESFADSRSQQGAPSIWIIKKLLAQTKALPTYKINGKPLTADVTFTEADFNIYPEATVRAKFSTLPTPAVVMKLGTRSENAPTNSEVAGKVLVDVRYDGSAWVGVYKPLIAVLQDGTEQTVAFL
jgi:hypothetical protein